MNTSARRAAPRPSTIRVCPECERTMTARRCEACDAATIPEAVLQPAFDALIGTTLQNQYRIEAELGRGGMGTVYRGTQLTIGRAVAIKVISEGYAGDLASIRRFRREARITSQLTHPNTIRVFDFGLTEAGQVFLVMELLQGRELAEQLQDDGRLSLARAIDICVQVLGALEEAHAAGVVHRDLKPANIFMQRVGDREIAKVMDFGIAKGGAEHSQMTKTGMMIGTPSYMSPEQSRGERVGPATDLYAIGIILYELLTGAVPFSAETPVATLLMHVANQPPRLRETRPDLAEVDAVQSVLDRFLCKEVAGRPANAAEAAALLNRLRNGVSNQRGSHEGDASPNAANLRGANLRGEPTGLTDGQGAQDASQRLTTRQQTQALVLIAALAALLLLGLGGGAVIWFVSARTSQTSQDRGASAPAAEGKRAEPSTEERPAAPPAPTPKPALKPASEPEATPTPKPEATPAPKPAATPAPSAAPTPKPTRASRRKAKVRSRPKGRSKPKPEPKAAKQPFMVE